MPTTHKLLYILVLASLFGCTKKDKDYEKYLTGGEIVYPGIVANVNYRAGDRRVQLKWNPSPDPSITKYKVYWNNRNDSMQVTATTHTPGDTVKVLIGGLKEYVYNFTVHSLDESGNMSIPLQVNNVKVYGPVYQGGLLNRPYNAANPWVINTDGSIQLNFNTPDTINIATQIRYTSTAGQVKDIILAPRDNSITIADFKFGTAIQYRSSYIPVATALDTFYATDFSDFPAVKRYEDVTTQYIQNPGNPFQRGDNGTGKWGLVKNWLYNTNLLNQSGSTAGGWSWDGNPSGVIHFEAQDWTGPGLANGKLYQTFTLPAGEYKASFYSDGGGGTTINGNFVVAVGTTLPDIDQLSGVIGQVHWDQNNVSGTHEMSFTLANSTTVAFGFVVSTGTTTWNHVNSITLKRLQ